MTSSLAGIVKRHCTKFFLYAQNGHIGKQINIAHITRLI